VQIGIDGRAGVKYFIVRVENMHSYVRIYIFPRPPYPESMPFPARRRTYICSKQPHISVCKEFVSGGSSAVREQQNRWNIW